MGWFGFLYSFRGRSIYYLLYIVFFFYLLISLGTLGFATKWWGGYLGGGLCIANFLWQWLCMCWHPDIKFWSSGGKLSLGDDPTMVYSTGESEMGQIIKNNPNATKAVMKAGMNAAKDNPELARQAIGVAAASNPYAV